ncbi:uncharacterized protein BDW70DRAFT_128215 [Aspergillus foveolatus]|uniref:uncharacterized protein n=1 Tax=Aspergillus foveolatus TaxID=210207 RepID=UPI003CCE1E53
MAKDMEVHARNVRNLVNGNVAGDQIGGNKITVEMRNVIFDPAIINEFGLNPSDFSDDIQRIGQLVSSMILAELKDNLSRPSSIIVGLPQTRRALEEFHTLRYTGTFDTCTRHPDVKLSDLLPHMVDPQSTFRYYTQVRNVRRRKEGGSLCLLRKSRQLQSWSAKVGSSQLLVRGSFRTRHTVRDFAADMIELLQKEKRPVAWVLQRKGTDSSLFDTVDVLKQLVSQLFQQRTGVLDERGASLAARRLQEAARVDDWFNLLGSILGGIKEVYLLFDTATFSKEAQEYQWAQGFAKLYDELRKRQAPTAIRAIFISCRPLMSRQLQTNFETVIDMSSSRAVQRLQSCPFLP